MGNFIAEIIGQEKTEEGIVVTVRMTGFGDREGALMTRAKARALVNAGIGPKVVQTKIQTDREGQFGLDVEERTATRDEQLFQGPASGIRENLQTFRREGLIAEVINITEKHPTGALGSLKLQEKFGENMMEFVNTFEYEVLVRTGFSFGP